MSERGNVLCSVMSERVFLFITRSHHFIIMMIIIVMLDSCLSLFSRIFTDTVVFDQRALFDDLNRLLSVILQLTESIISKLLREEV